MSGRGCPPRSGRRSPPRPPRRSRWAGAPLRTVGVTASTVRPSCRSCAPVGRSVRGSVPRRPLRVDTALAADQFGDVNDGKVRAELRGHRAGDRQGEYRARAVRMATVCLEHDHPSLGSRCALSRRVHHCGDGVSADFGPGPVGSANDSTSGCCSASLRPPPNQPSRPRHTGV